MNNLILGRRKFIYLCFMSTVLGLSSCGIVPESTIIRGAKNSLPEELVRKLPENWTFREFKIKPGTDPYSLGLYKKTDYFILEDGWLSTLSAEYFEELENQKHLQNLDSQASLFLDSLGNRFNKKVFPLGVSPWVILFRNGEEFLPEAQESWSVLLDNRLKGEIIFPNSPRLLLSIIDRINSINNLGSLKNQIKSYDDKYSISWLTSGKAKAVVLPLNRCREALFRDPRLSVALPKEGAPLNWTIMLKVKNSKSIFSYEWLEDSWDLASLGPLISKGFLPPVDYSRLIEAKSFVPQKYKAVFAPELSTWKKCWSLPILSNIEKRDLAIRWNGQ